MSASTSGTQSGNMLWLNALQWLHASCGSECRGHLFFSEGHLKESFNNRCKEGPLWGCALFWVGSRRLLVLLCEGDAVGVHLIRGKRMWAPSRQSLKWNCVEKGDTNREQEILADIKSFFTGCLDLSGLHLRLYRDQSAGWHFPLGILSKTLHRHKMHTYYYVSVSGTCLRAYRQCWSRLCFCQYMKVQAETLQVFFFSAACSYVATCCLMIFSVILL